MELINKINSLLVEAHSSLGYDTCEAYANFSSRRELCEFQCNSAFGLAKKNRTNPALIATNLVKELTKLSSDFLFSNIGGFLNISLTNSCYSSLLKEIVVNDRCGIPTLEKSKTIIVDFGGANIAKPLHVGHLRSAVIGEALKNLAVFMGNKVVGDTHLGDWGLQMGLTISLLCEVMDCSYYWGKSKTKPVITLDILNDIYPAASKRAKVDEDFKRKAQETTTVLQKGIGPVFDMWKDIRAISIEAVKKDYNNLGVHFDLWNGESDASSFEEPLLKLLESKNLLVESDGAIIVNVKTDDDNAPIPPCIIKASTGASLYATTDLATIMMREKMFKMDEIWYVVDARQTLHLEQVFRVARLASLVPENTKFFHICFGTMNGKDGKPFKTREGGTLKLGDLTNLIREEAQKKLAENNVADENNLSHKIGLSALKFGDMINQTVKDYVFDIEKFSSFEGKTGPYVLYSMVRILSILQKNNNEIVFENFVIDDQSEKDVIFEIVAFCKSTVLAYEEKEPSILCAAMYSLALTFSTFYAKNKILTEPNSEKRNTLLAICLATKKALQIACDILSIECPEKM
ncbi:MAG: arginine--tRNA ligase [Clostridia bacterium]